jgi:uncharacterized protein YegP (UPF0339 family)
MFYSKRWVGPAAVLALLVCIGGPNSAWGQAKPKTDGAMATFEIYADHAGEHRWRLKGADGSTLATSGEGYKAIADCRKAVERIKGEVKGDKLTFDVYEDKAKEHRWRLKAKNGDIVAASPAGFKTKAECDKAIAVMKKDAPNARVEEKAEAEKGGGKDAGKEAGRDAPKDAGKGTEKKPEKDAGKGSSAALFEVYADAAKEYRWRLRDTDGSILATGDGGHKDKAACRAALDVVREGVKSGKLSFELYEDKAGEHRWRLKDKSGGIVAAAPKGYKAKADCEKAVDAIKKEAPKAKVEEK